MTFEVAFRRVPHLVGQPLIIKGDAEFSRPFMIIEVTEQMVRCKNEVEEFSLTRMRIASLYQNKRIHSYKAPQIT